MARHALPSEAGTFGGGKFAVLSDCGFRVEGFKAVKQHDERQFLLRGAGVFGTERSVSAADITYPD